jgi:hypothetical protein
LTIRTPEITADIRWSDLESIIVDDLRVLVVLDAAGQATSYPGITNFARSAPDGRAGYEILALAQVHESPEQIASALAQHAGVRFTDARSR